MRSRWQGRLSLVVAVSTLTHRHDFYSPPVNPSTLVTCYFRSLVAPLLETAGQGEKVTEGNGDGAVAVARDETRTVHKRLGRSGRTRAKEILAPRHARSFRTKGQRKLAWCVSKVGRNFSDPREWDSQPSGISPTSWFVSVVTSLCVFFGIWDFLFFIFLSSNCIQTACGTGSRTLTARTR